MEKVTVQKFKLEEKPEYVRQRPYVSKDGIYVPCNEYSPKGSVSVYRCILSKEMFVEAYNKWIKGEE